MDLQSIGRLQLVMFNIICGLPLYICGEQKCLYNGSGGAEVVLEKRMSIYLLSFAHLHFRPLMTVFSDRAFICYLFFDMTIQ